MWGNIAGMDQATADAIVERSLAAGVNFIDTADIYSFGESEEMLGQSLKNLSVPRKNVVLATKLYNPMSSGPNDRGTSRVHIINSLEASLERLQTDYIDLYQIHANDTVTPIDEMLRTFDDLISRGLVRVHRRVELAGLAHRQGASAWPSGAATRVSNRCRPTTRSPAAISNARWCR